MNKIKRIFAVLAVSLSLSFASADTVGGNILAKYALNQSYSEAVKYVALVLDISEKQADEQANENGTLANKIFMAYMQGFISGMGFTADLFKE